MAAAFKHQENSTRLRQGLVRLKCLVRCVNFQVNSLGLRHW